jgi:hypothetical protein
MVLATTFAGASLAGETKSARTLPGGNMPCHANGKQYAPGRMMSGGFDNVGGQPNLEQLRQIPVLAALQADLRVRRSDMVRLWLAEKPNGRQLAKKLRQISDLDLQLQEQVMNYQLASGARAALPASHRYGSPGRHKGMFHGARFRRSPPRASGGACH